MADESRFRIARAHHVAGMITVRDNVSDTLGGRGVRWDALAEARLVSAADLALLERFDKKSEEEQADVMQTVRSRAGCSPTNRLRFLLRSAKD